MNISIYSLYEIFINEKKNNNVNNSKYKSLYKLDLLKNTKTVTMKVGHTMQLNLWKIRL